MHRARQLLLVAALALLGPLAARGSEDDHAGHDHGGSDNPWEWAGVFDFHDDDHAHYTFLASVKENAASEDPHAGHDHRRMRSRQLSGVKAAWPDASMTVVMVKTTTNDAAGIEAAEATAKTIFNATSATAYTDAITVNTNKKLVFSNELVIQS